MTASTSSNQKKRSEKKRLEDTLLEALVGQRDIPPWENYPDASGYKFNTQRRGKKGRNMTFDIAWPEYRVAIEVNGGQWSTGKMGHNSGTGVERDARKQNDAALLGWVVLWFVTDHIDKELTQYTIPTIRKALLLQGASIVDFEAALQELFNDEQRRLDD